jgi:ATP-dependent DNA helicase PIF1
MTLSEDQQDIFDKYVAGNNIFITGPGGCGKSYLIKQIVKHAESTKKNINVCAMTGCAAILLDCGATTLHSWAGIGLAKADDEIIITRIMMNKYKKSNWKRTHVLIIDEVSMMSKRLFNLLDAIGKRVRKSAKPFGGIQLIFSGDFYQLPPVGDKLNPDTSQFCFESDHWNETFDFQMLLDKAFRQKDETYIEILNQIREGKIYKEAYDILKTRVGVEMPKESITKPVVLYPTKRSVETINKIQLDELQTAEVEFDYKVVYDETVEKMGLPGFKKPTKKQMAFEEKYIVNNSLFEPSLTLKVGCQVMCIINLDMDNGICNGSTGLVIDIMDVQNTTTDKSEPKVKVKFNNGVIRTISRHGWESDNIRGFSVQQIPLILAWAVTIHKSQGATLAEAEIDIGSSIFAEGQTYVALSRVKSLEGLYLTSFSAKRIKASEKVQKFYEQFYEEEDEEDEEEDEEDDEDTTSNGEMERIDVPTNDTDDTATQN